MVSAPLATSFLHPLGDYLGRTSDLTSNSTNTVAHKIQLHIDGQDLHQACLRHVWKISRKGWQVRAVSLTHFNPLVCCCFIFFLFFFFLTDFTTIQRKNELDSHKTDQRSGGVKKKDGGPRRMGRIMVGGNAKSRNC